jgi:hypothetical protein
MRIDDLDLDKLAARLPSKEAVDAILSLGYLRKDTLSIFKDQIDYLKHVESTLAQLLILARLGQDELDEDSIETAMKSLNEVVEALESDSAEDNILTSRRSSKR